MAKHKLSFAEFGETAIADWEAKLLQDLKGATISAKGLPIDALENMPIAIPVAPNKSQFALIGSRSYPLLSVRPHPMENSALMASLMGGANALIIEERMAHTAWKDLLSEVDLSFLDVTLRGNASYVSDFFRFLNTIDQTTCSGAQLGLSAEQEFELFEPHSPIHANWRFFNIAAPSASLDAPDVIASFLKEANTRLELLADAGVLSSGAPSFSCQLPVGTSFLTTLMSIRAIRLAWALLLSAWKEDSAVPIFIQCETDVNFLEAMDEEKNMIRSASMAASVVMGGADALWLRPVNEGANRTEFYHRIARNNLHLFEQEGKLSWVNDPAAGAAYIEQGTERIAEKAWDIFRGK